MRHKARVDALEKKIKPEYDRPVVLGFYPENFEGFFTHKGKVYPIEQLEEVAMSLNIPAGYPRIVGCVYSEKDKAIVKQIEEKTNSHQGFKWCTDNITFVWPTIQNK